jgi:DNA primase catalytic subunit
MEANPEESGKTKREEAARKQTESIFEFLKNKYNTNRLFYFLTDTDRQKISFFMTLHKAIRKRRFRRKKSGRSAMFQRLPENFSQSNEGVS